ncbi:Uncharacterized RING finger protein [Morus notabilis]|uniref:Uncharacterized RING finger protein n=1 Tax=Morus notabilis TaxID=981085 RepID=W9RQW5_9ROSA|nr:putative RING-H2 finger protein ATL69 [Morus notabilis]EXB65353.1 Uncharacterized RING finger protein [Morus notabilis]
MQISPSPSPVSPPISPPDHITHEVQGSFLQWAPLLLIVLGVLSGIVDIKVSIDAHDQEQTQVALQRLRLQRPSAQPQPSPTVPPSEMISSIICTYRIEKPEAAAVAVESGGDCAICLEDFKYGDECRIFVSCNHGFHRACVDEWLVRNRHCPLCRGSVRGLRSANVDDQV